MRSQRLSATLVILSAAALGGVAVANSGPTVSTSDGPVRGFINNSGVNEFRGIPYAAPPVGSLRWMPPAAPGSHALLDATVSQAK